MAFDFAAIRADGDDVNEVRDVVLHRHQPPEIGGQLGDDPSLFEALTTAARGHLRWGARDGRPGRVRRRMERGSVAGA